ARVGQLREITALRLSVKLIIHARQINPRFAALAYRRPGLLESDGNQQFAGEYVYCTERENSKAGFFKSAGSIADPVENFVERAVATGSDDDLEPFGNRFSCQTAGITHGSRQFQRATRSQVVEVTAEAFGFLAASGRIEYDASAHGVIFGAG